MRLGKSTVFSFVFLFPASLTLWSACTTTNGGSVDSSAYDGTVDSMDSLPDCGPDSLNSMFWVRDKKGAFECMKDNQWKQRANAKRPDDADEDKSGDEMSPRIVK